MIMSDWILVTNQKTQRRLFVHIPDIKFAEETTDGVFIALEIKRGRAFGVTVTESLEAINCISHFLDVEGVTFADGKRGLFMSNSIETIFENSEGKAVIRVKNMTNGFLLSEDFESYQMNRLCASFINFSGYEEDYDDDFED